MPLNSILKFILKILTKPEFCRTSIIKTNRNKTCIYNDFSPFQGPKDLLFSVKRNVDFDV